MKLLLLLKKAIISSRMGVFFDERVRLVLSFIPLVHSKLSRNRPCFSPDSFVLFLHGGIGDALLVFPLIQRLSKEGNVVVFCESKILNLDFLLPNCVRLVEYDKNTLFGSRAQLRENITGQFPLFIQTSPIIELYFIRRMLGIKKAIGLISDFNNIRSIGFGSSPTFLHTESRVEMYNKIYGCVINNQPNGKTTQNHIDFEVSCESSEIKNLIQTRYVVLSAMKTSEWEMGKMPKIEYAKLADYLANIYGYQVIFVGDDKERGLVDDIVALCANSDKMHNISGQTNLKDLSCVLLNAQFVVSNDNGVSHFSSLLKVKTLVLFMFSDYKVYRWNHGNYAYLFNKFSECMPCVKLSRYPKDNYPVICRNNLMCNNSMTYHDIVNKLENLNWCIKKI